MSEVDWDDKAQPNTHILPFYLFSLTVLYNISFSRGTSTGTEPHLLWMMISDLITYNILTFWLNTIFLLPSYCYAPWPLLLSYGFGYCQHLPQQQLLF